MKNVLVLFLFLFISAELGTGLQSLSSRSPSSTPQTCSEILASFYTEERNKILPERIKNTGNDLHLFYRSFPPLFYKMAEEQNWRNHFGAISSFLSIMAGDAHMENFGLRFYKGKIRLSVNDFDDLTYGPPFLDLLRLLSSARIAGVDVDEKLIEKVIKSYRKGLSQKDWKYSESIKDLQKKSAKSDVLDEDNVDIKAKKFAAKKAPNEELKPEVLKTWQSVLEEIGEIRDSYLYIKQTGGSAGLKRFQFLIEQKGKLRWIEAKEWTTPSFNTGNAVKTPHDLKRFEAIKTYDKPDFAPKLVKFSSKTFLLRQMDDRQKGVALAGLSPKKLEEILLDEAYSLGEFHQTFLPDSKNYARTLENTVRAADMEGFVLEMAKQMESAFTSIK